jgi:hypothetical protein
MTEDVKKEVPFEQQGQQSGGLRFTETIEDAKAMIVGDQKYANLPTELEGMDRASLDKYLKEGVFDWASYGKEQAFKAKQKPAGEEDKPAADTAETGGKDGENKDLKEDKKEDKDEPLSDEKKDQLKDVAADAGVDWEGAANSIVSEGKLSDEDKAKLVKQGIPEIVIDDYVRLLHREAGDKIANVITKLGGEANFEAVFDGLQANATEQQRNHIDSLLKHPDTFDAGIQLAVNLSKAQVDTQGAPTGGTNQAAPTKSSAKPYTDFNEQMTAQRDPRYKTDVKYRNEVMMRIAASEYSLNPRTHSGGL